MKAIKSPAKRVIDYCRGENAHFGSEIFYQIHLKKTAVAKLDQLLGQVNTGDRCGVMIAATFGQPDRLRVIEVAPPQYESRAAANYVRGDSLRVQGRPGVSCNLEFTAHEVPDFRAKLKGAAKRAKEFIALHVPSRKRNLIELIPDTDLSSGSGDEEAIARASMSMMPDVFPIEDFSDWEM